MSKKQRFEINWFAAAGSALGAVSSAVVLSTLGAAGTLIGAAVGSLVITVGGTIYTQSLQKTKAHVDTRRGAGRSGRSGSATSPVGRESQTQSTVVGAPNSATSQDVPEPLMDFTEAGAPKPPRKPLGEILRGLPWKHVLLLAAGLFVAAMVIILVFELSTGRPVSSYTGGSRETRTGTTFDALKPSTVTSDDAENPDLPLGEESASPTPSAEPQPTEAQPTETQPTEAQATEDEPTETPTQEQPTEEPTATEIPTEQPTAAETTADPVAPVETPAEQQPTTG